VTIVQTAAAKTRMYQEAAEAPERIQSQVDLDGDLYAELSHQLRRLRPRLVVTCARGSSDHAATYARYLMETQLGVLTTSASPSVNSVYRVRQDLSECVFLAISQSGSSPDLLSAASAARAAGALVVALVNADHSPLEDIAHHRLPMRAGVESSVAATKSYICTLAAMVHLVAHWADSEPLLRAFAGAPQQLTAAWQLDWQGLVSSLMEPSNLFVLGRGLGLGVAQEAALKLKETCALHAEAYSGAEVRHGPMAILSEAMPVLMFSQDDETRPSLESLARELSAEGIRVLFAGSRIAGTEELPTLASHPSIAPLLLAQSFYRAAATLSVARGLNPDCPPRLKKVTKTM
jgi:glutamine---fructose-6-phosphate transaminase (isomerizing)